MRTDPPQMEMNVVPVRRSGVRCHELDGEAVLYDPAHHALHYLNATAYFLWSRCDGQTTLAEFLHHADHSFSYDGDAATLHREVFAAFSHLAENGLVDWGQLEAA